MRTHPARPPVVYGPRDESQAPYLSACDEPNSETISGLVRLRCNRTRRVPTPPRPWISRSRWPHGSGRVETPTPHGRAATSCDASC